MKSKVIILAACSVMVLLGCINAAYKNYIKLKTQNMNLINFIFSCVFFTYLSLLPILATYSYSTGLCPGFVYIAWVPLWMLGMYACYKVMLIKKLSTKTFYIMAIAGSFIIYLGCIGIYNSIYLPYIKHLFN
jgi:hypothetical protein